MMLTTHLHLLSRLRMSGVVPALPPCSLMVLIEKSLHFFCTVNVVPSVGGSRGVILVTHCVASTVAKLDYLLS